MWPRAQHALQSQVFTLQHELARANEALHAEQLSMHMMLTPQGSSVAPRNSRVDLTTP